MKGFSIVMKVKSMFNIEEELKKLPKKPGVYIMHDKNNMSNAEINQKVLDMFLEKKVITVDSAQKLIDMNKIQIEDESILDKYR